MSETAWPSRAQVPPFLRPEVMIGAASPLWGYFTGAVAAGVGFWWMTRWMHAGAVPVLAAPRGAIGLAEAAVAPALEAAQDKLPEMPVGGEAAPVSPVLEAPAVEAALGLDVTSPVEAPPPAETPASETPASEAAAPQGEPADPRKTVAEEDVPKAAAPPAAPEEKLSRPPPPSRARKPRDGEPKPH